MIDFKPSQVMLAAIPLVDTMHKAEVEFAAALVVRVCQVQGDSWQAVGFDDVAKALTADVEAGTPPFAKLVNCPVFRPDVWRLVTDGYARWTDHEGGAVEFTDKGFDAIRKHVKDGAS